MNFNIQNISFSILPFLIAVYFLSVGIFVIRKDSKNSVNLTFFFLSITTFFWQFSWSVLFQISDPKLGFAIVKIGYFFIIFLPTFLYHFLVSLANRKSDIKYVKISYFACLIFAIFDLFTNYFVAGTYNYFWGFYPKAGFLHPFHVFQTSIVVLRGLYIVFKKIGDLSNQKQIQQLKYSMVALFIYFFAAFDYLCNYGVEFYPPGLIFVFTSLSILFYSITKHKLMDVSLVVSRAFGLFLTASLFSFVFIAIQTVTDVILERTFNVFANITGILLLLGTGILFDKVRIKIQSTTDKLFIKGQYNYKKVIIKLSEKLYQCTEISSLFKELKSVFIEEIEISPIHLLIPENFEHQKDISKNLVHYLDNQSSNRIAFNASASFLETIKDMDRVIKVENIDGDDRTALDANGIKLLVQCRNMNGDLVCLLLLGKKMSEDPFNEDDIDLLTTLSTQISTVLQRIKQARVAAEMGVAQKIQTEILPKNPTVTGLSLSCYMQPADEVGGDYYDVIRHKDMSWIVLGDVTGHGVGSGLTMFMVQSIMTTLIQTQDITSPAQLNFLANQILSKNLERLDEQLPMTIVTLCTKDGRHFTVSGSHDNIYIYRAKSKEVEAISVENFPLGIGLSGELDREMFGENQFELEEDDILFVGTDGVTEAPEQGDITKGQFSEERLMTLIKDNGEKDLGEIKASLLDRLDSFTLGNYADDVTFILAKATKPSLEKIEKEKVLSAS